MRYSQRRAGSLLSAVVLAVLAAGCTSGDDDAPVDDGQDDGQVVGDAEQDGGDDLDEAQPVGRLQLTGWQEDHRSLVTMALRAIEVDEAGHLLVDFEAANARTGAGVVRLGSRAVLVRDDLGNDYPFLPPPDNGTLEFNTDERMTGTLAFEGPVDPDATSVTVAFNQRPDEPFIAAADDNLSPNTRFLFEGVPLPGAGLEDEADRGGGGDPLDTVQEVEVDVTVQPEANEDLSVTVLRYTTDGRTVSIDLEAVNRSNVPVELTSGDPYLRDGLGTRYIFQRAESEDRDERVLRMEPGDEVSAVLAWRGIIPDDAEFLAVEFGSSDFQSESGPHVYIELPLPEQGR